MKNVRAIISGIRTHYDINTAPPVVDGVQKFHPCDLVENCPWNFTKDPQLFNDLQQLLDIQYQLKSTKKQELLTQLTAQKFKLHHQPRQLIEILQWLADHSVREHQLSWSSIFEVGIDKWKRVSVESYIYHSQKEKEDPNQKPTQIKIPFYKNGMTQWEQISLLLKQTSKQNTYEAVCGPYVSCLDLTSYFESLFVFSYLLNTFIQIEYE